MDAPLITVQPLLEQVETMSSIQRGLYFCNDIIIKVKVHSFHPSCGTGSQGTGKMDSDNQSAILKITNYTYNFIKQQCQAGRVRKANRSLSVKSQLGIGAI